MKTCEERAREWATDYPKTPDVTYTNSDIEAIVENSYMQGDNDRKAIDKDLIEMLIDELLTSRMYHLGITGLDSAEERHRKEIENDCALVRGIDTTIKYVREIMKE